MADEKSGECRGRLEKWAVRTYISRSLIFVGFTEYYGRGSLERAGGIENKTD